MGATSALPSVRAILSVVYSRTNLCSPITMCGPFCSVPAVAMITDVLPCSIRSLISSHVSSSMNTVPGGFWAAAGAAALITAVRAGAGPAAAPLAGQAAPAARQLPTVVVLATGGTIASTYDEATGGFRPALTAEQLVGAVPGLDTIARVEMVQVAN